MSTILNRYIMYAKISNEAEERKYEKEVCKDKCPLFKVELYESDVDLDQIWWDNEYESHQRD